MKADKKFSIIIANFNGIRYIHDCLSSVIKTDHPSFEIILIEDGSFDGSQRIIEEFRRKYHFKVIKNKANLGLVASRNRAIDQARGEILMFLDNDTQVDMNWLKGLDAVFKDKSVGAAQCKIFDYHKRKIIQEVGMKLVPFTGFGTPVGRGEFDQGQYDNLDGIISLGAALAVRRDLAKKLGGFDNQLFHYTDDLDFSWRIWIAGFKIVLAPKAIVYHYTKQHTANFHLYFHLAKNSVRMLVKNYQLLNVAKYLPAAVLINLAGGLVVLIRQKSISGIVGVICGFIWNIIFLTNTLRSRRQVSNIRKSSDHEIMPQMMLKPSILGIYNLYLKTAKSSSTLTDCEK